MEASAMVMCFFAYIFLSGKYEIAKYFTCSSVFDSQVIGSGILRCVTVAAEKPVLQLCHIFKEVASMPCCKYRPYFLV